MAASEPAALTDGERAFLAALSELGVACLLVGMSAALLQGALKVTDRLK